jgi:hypothetical protein
MNQFFYQITRKASELISSDDYRMRNVTKQTAFTRNRKLTFPVMIVLLLNFLTRTMQIELDDFFANVLDTDTDSVTKQAFFKARKNILPDAFKELFFMTRDMVLSKNKGNTAQRLCVRCAVRFFVRLCKNRAGRLGCYVYSSCAEAISFGLRAVACQGIFVRDDGKYASK